MVLHPYAIQKGVYIAHGESVEIHSAEDVWNYQKNLQKRFSLSDKPLIFFYYIPERYDSSVVNIPDICDVDRHGRIIICQELFYTREGWDGDYSGYITENDVDADSCFCSEIEASKKMYDNTDF